jgi:hypothetical protein
LFSAQTLFRSLDEGPGDLESRSMADLELRILAGREAPHLALTDWVPRQVTAMGAWERWVRDRAPELSRGFRRARA